MSRLFIIVRQNPDGPDLVTHHVDGLDRMRRRLREYLIVNVILLAVGVFGLAAVTASYHLPWWMVSLIVAVYLLTSVAWALGGFFFGEFHTWRDIEQGDVRSEFLGGGSE